NPTLTQTPTIRPTGTPIPTINPTLTPTIKPTITVVPTVRPTTVPTLTPTPTQGQAKTGLKFAVMADIHNNTGGLKKMMKKAKSDGMEIVVLAGDLTEDGKRSELTAIKKVLDGSGMRYEATEGNHDMRQSLFDNIFGKSFQSIRFDGIKLILIDNSDYRGLDKGVLSGKGQKAWIEKEVAECKTIICVGIMHMPLNHPTSDHLMGEANGNTAKEAVWLRKLLVSSGVKEIETGHIHHFKTYTINGLKTNQVGSGSSSDFSEFTIDSSGKITRKQITL
ncbi:MAG: metallophosphoesterase, partial [Candidatus Shapirobacteria bacterium]|nr:metallophosphoesterase [Candidatus Shapirobacteria bacterium]